jgi:hypothetical protein
VSKNLRSKNLFSRKIFFWGGMRKHEIVFFLFFCFHAMRTA